MTICIEIYTSQDPLGDPGPHDGKHANNNAHARCSTLNMCHEFFFEIILNPFRTLQQTYHKIDLIRLALRIYRSISIKLFPHGKEFTKRYRRDEPDHHPMHGTVAALIVVTSATEAIRHLGTRAADSEPPTNKTRRSPTSAPSQTSTAQSAGLQMQCGRL